MSDKVTVENVNHPGQESRVDAAKYNAMKDALMAVLPPRDAAMTYAEMKTALLPKLSDDHFPGGATSGWWLKCVHLDLEAKGAMMRHPTKPLTFSQV